MQARRAAAAEAMRAEQHGNRATWIRYK